MDVKDIVAVSGAVSGVVTALYWIFSKVIVEPMLTKALADQSAQLRNSLVTEKEFQEAVDTDKREHDGIQRAIQRIQDRLDRVINHVNDKD